MTQRLYLTELLRCRRAGLAGIAYEHWIIHQYARSWWGFRTFAPIVEWLIQREWIGFRPSNYLFARYLKPIFAVVDVLEVKS